MPERFLLQILRSLVTHGILKSSRGVDGGYILLRDSEELSVLDVVEAIDGPLVHDRASGEGLPEPARVLLCAALQEVTQTTRRQLKAIRLSEMASISEGGCQPAGEDATLMIHGDEAATSAVANTWDHNVDAIGSRQPVSSGETDRGASL